MFPFLDVTPEELMAACQRVVLLHGVQDPGNVGTVIRSAHAFGAGVALSKGCADLYNPKTSAPRWAPSSTLRVARAGLARVPGAGSWRWLRHRGRRPCGGDVPRSLPDGRLVIAVGAEGAGLPQEVVEASRARVTIPSLAASLNAAIAASILLYEAYMRVLP